MVTLEMLRYHWKIFGGSRMARKARKRDKCAKNMDFVALPGGAEGAKTFWGLSWVYKSTTQKKKK